MEPRMFHSIGRVPDRIDLEEIASLIRGGRVVILPTDTIYGFHADASNSDAVATIFTIKARDGRKPLVVLAADLEQVASLGAKISEESREILQSIWPAALTAILPLEKSIPASADTSTLAVRIPDAEWLLDLLLLTGPIVSTSVNRSGEQPLYTMTDLARETKSEVAAVLDMGVLPGKASTIVDFTKALPEVVRQGDFWFRQELWKTSRKSL